MGSRGRHKMLQARRKRRRRTYVSYWAGSLFCSKPGAALSFFKRLTEHDAPLREAYERAVAAESERLMRRIMGTAEEASE